MSYTFFKYASILQGVYKRGLQGQASQEESLTFKHVPRTMANLGLKLIKESGKEKEPIGKSQQACSLILLHPKIGLLPPLQRVAVLTLDILFKNLLFKASFQFYPKH